MKSIEIANVKFSLLIKANVEDDNVENVIEETTEIIETAGEITAEYVDYVADIVDKTAEIHHATQEVLSMNYYWQTIWNKSKQTNKKIQKLKENINKTKHKQNETK